MEKLEYLMGWFNVRSSWGANPSSLSGAWAGTFPDEDLPDEDGWISSTTANSMRAGYELIGWEVSSALAEAYDATTGRRHGRDTIRKLLHRLGPAGYFIKNVRGLPGTQVASIQAYAVECARERADGVRERTGRTITDVSSGSLLD